MTADDPLGQPCAYCHAYPIDGSKPCPGAGDGMHRRTEHALASPEHDTQVAARALREAAVEALREAADEPGCGEWTDVADWLHDRADRIKKEET